MPRSTAVFLTWTTYGTWLPGDSRGWNLSGKGRQIPQPLLERWVEGRLRETPFFLSETQRAKVDSVCRQHASIRNWELPATNVRTNHIHIVVLSDRSPERTRDEFKAWSTRALRQPPDSVQNTRIWARGGYWVVIDSDVHLAAAVRYVNELQD